MSDAGPVPSSEAVRRRPPAGDSGSREAGFRVDPGWRNTHGGYAVRLDARTTIDVGDPVGRWRGVDPRVPHAGWRTVGKTVGFLSWSGAVAFGWWMGARRGTGPLRVLQRGAPPVGERRVDPRRD